MKRVKATSALLYRTETADNTVEPNIVVELDDAVADSFIASGAAILIADESPAVAEVLEVEAAPEALEVVEAADAAPKFGKRR